MHIILTGSDEIIKSRINSDKTSERDISFLPSNLEFLKNNFDVAIRIDTSKKKACCNSDRNFKVFLIIVYNLVFNFIIILVIN